MSNQTQAPSRAHKLNESSPPSTPTPSQEKRRSALARDSSVAKLTAGAKCDAEKVLILERHIALGMKRDEERMKDNRDMRQRLEDQFAAGEASARRAAAFELSLVGRGSFGEIYTFALQTTVYKLVKSGDEEQASKLLDEFRLLIHVYDALGDASEPHHFTSPRPYEFYDPSAKITNIVASASPDRVGICAAHRSPRVKVAAATWGYFSRPVMVMDLIPALHPAIGQAYRHLFYDGTLKGKEIQIRMLRLYFGRTFPAKTLELAPGELITDPPLDEDRYRALAGLLQDVVTLPDPEDIAMGMGKLLATLHYEVGVDGSDAELVLAGDHYHSARCVVFDYNQVTYWLPRGYLTSDSSCSITPVGRWTGCTVTDAAKRLALKIHGQEAYYPRYRHKLYPHFASAYRAATQAIMEKHDAPSHVISIIIPASEAFLQEYERLDQAKRVTRPRLSLAELEARAAEAALAAKVSDISLTE